MEIKVTPWKGLQPGPARPYSCSVCNGADVKDVLVEARLVPVSRAICGDCKVKMGGVVRRWWFLEAVKRRANQSGKG